MNINELREKVRAERGAAKKRYLKENGPGGFLRSRGVWVVVSCGNSENKISNGECEFKSVEGVAKWAAFVAEQAADPRVDSIYLEGGFDWAESLVDFRDGGYDPYVEEWGFEAWNRSLQESAA